MIVIAAAFTTACGDESTYAERANAVCREAQQAQRPDRTKATTKNELARVDAEIKRLEEQALRALGAVEPPQGRERVARRWLHYLGRWSDASWDLLDATREGHDTDAEARAAAAASIANRLAAQLGATECIGPGGYTSYAPAGG